MPVLCPCYACCQVLSKLPVMRLRRNTLFVDVLSVKEFPKRLLLAQLPPEVGGLGWDRAGLVLQLSATRHELP